MERALAGEPCEYEAEIDYRYGGRRAIHARYAPYPGPDGDIVGVVCPVTDIMARRPAHRALVRLAAIVDCSDDAIITKDLDGRITSWNASAGRMFGYTAEEALGPSVAMQIPDERQSEE